MKSTDTNSCASYRMGRSRGAQGLAIRSRQAVSTTADRLALSLNSDTKSVDADIDSERPGSEVSETTSCESGW